MTKKRAIEQFQDFAIRLGGLQPGEVDLVVNTLNSTPISLANILFAFEVLKESMTDYVMYKDSEVHADAVAAGLE
jgi:hypothetical protein